MEKTVIYNAKCPICAREVAAYRRYSEARGLPLRFSGLQDGAAEDIGVTRDAAARRLHVVAGTEVLAGVPAFVSLWEEMPRFRWLARVLSLPVIRSVAEVVYEFGLAPLLYAMHRRRAARGGGSSDGASSAEARPRR